MRDSQRLLLSVIDRLIPPDESGPSASDNGVAVYLERVLAGAMREHAAAIADGLTQLDRAAREPSGRGFAERSPADQDALLHAAEDGRLDRADWPAATWFGLLVRLTHEGYYADPGNGGNPDGAAWRMVGFDPRRAL